MTRKTDREDRIIDRLHEENRQLKKKVKNLMLTVRKLNKGYYKVLEEETVESKDRLVEEITKKLCHECSGEYREIIVANRRWRQCQVCSKKGKVSILKS